jgi:Mannosyl-glycoprotein endo-beta-N-acetylglucosaminidase
MTSAGFAAVLKAAGSPAASSAAAAYRAAVDHGVDPTVLLAVFRKESTFGRFGRAAHNRSWGNLRGGKTYPLDSGGFRIYPTWEAGAADCARLLAIYGRNQIRPGVNTSTVQRFPYVWAPSSDGNAPDRYGDTLASWIRQWSGDPGSTGSPDASPVSYSPSNDAGPLLGPFLESIGRTLDDPMREEDVIPWMQYLQRAGKIPGGSPNQNPLVNAFLIETRKLIGKPWREVGAAYLQAATEQDPFGLQGIGQAIAGIPAAIGDVLTHVAILLAILGVVALGLYLVATANDASGAAAAA